MLVVDRLQQNSYFAPQSEQLEPYFAAKKTPKPTKHDAVAKDEKKDRKFLNIGVSSGILLLVILMSSKGLQKIVGDNVNKLKDFLEYRVEENSLGDQGKIQSFNNYIFRKISGFLNKSKSINNITSLKDILFKRMMYLTKPTRKIHIGISDAFEKLSIKTLDKSSKNTKKVFEQMYEKFDKLDEYILKNSGEEIINYNGREYKISEMVEKARGNRENVKMSVDAFFSYNAFKKRYNFIKGSNSKLCSTFWDASFKDFWTSDNKFKRKEMWQTFIAEEQMKGEKTKLAEDVAYLRNMLSYNHDDKGIAVSRYLNELKNMLPDFDKSGYNQVKKLEWFVKHSDALKNNREMFIRELNNLCETKKVEKVDPQVIKKLEECKKNYVDLITEIVNEDGIGEIQDMISIYYKIAPFELEKFGALASVKKSVSAFDKSVNLEISEFFDKVRDLELGSAPTDILTIVLSSILITVEMLKAKNKEEKHTVILTSGIPLAGAIATTIIATTKLISGGKSLALGAISGLILNIIGRRLSKSSLFPQNNNSVQ